MINFSVIMRRIPTGHLTKGEAPSMRTKVRVYPLGEDRFEFDLTVQPNPHRRGYRFPMDPDTLRDLIDKAEDMWALYERLLLAQARLDGRTCASEPSRGHR